MGARIGQAVGDLGAGLRAARLKRILQEPMWHAAVGRLLYLGWLTFAILPMTGNRSSRSHSDSSLGFMTPCTGEKSTAAHRRSRACRMTMSRENS